MTDTLPIAVVIPHAGLDVPLELTDRLALTEHQIFNEADVYADMLYDFRGRVAHWHSFPYARAILDVNRPKEPHPALRNGDGFVKQRTSYGAPVYKAGQVPDAALEQHLIETYWQPWHDTMAELAADERIKLVIDGHSMAATAPDAYDASRSVRPRIAICNLGDENGDPRAGDIISAPAELARMVAQTLGNALADLPDLAPTAQAYAVNVPYRGGPILWLHGNKAQPWIMIELSRATYVGLQTGETLASPPQTERIADIRERLWDAIVTIVAQL